MSLGELSSAPNQHHPLARPVEAYQRRAAGVEGANDHLHEVESLADHYGPLGPGGRRFRLVLGAVDPGKRRHEVRPAFSVGEVAQFLPGSSEERQALFRLGAVRLPRGDRGDCHRLSLTVARGPMELDRATEQLERVLRVEGQ